MLDSLVVVNKDNIVGYRLIPIYQDEYDERTNDWLNRPNIQQLVKCMITGDEILPIGGPQNMVISQKLIRKLLDER